MAYLIVNKTNDTNEEYHVNLYPLIKETDSGLGRNILTVLGKTLDLIDVNKGKYELRSSDPSSLFSDSIASFDGANFNGDINIQANSSIISPQEPRVEFLIDGKSYFFDRITQITPLHMNGVNVSTSYADIEGYSGFYSRILLNNSTEIRLHGDPIILSLINDEGEEQIVSGEEIQIFLNKGDIISRQPDITTKGISYFKQFYPYGNLDQKFDIYDKDLLFDGKTKLEIAYGDKYIMSEGTSLNGNILSPLLDYYANAEAINLLKWPDIGYYLLLAFILAVFNIYRRKHVLKN